jgi:hypothetical protein
MFKRLLIMALIMQMLVLSASALIVTIDLSWSLTPDYNVQNGSIVQVVAYRTGGGIPGGGPTADDNFMVTGEYMGESTYDAYSTTDSRYDIVYETTVEQDFNYFVYEQFELLGNYNRIYIRIFDATNLSDEITLSYWGLTPIVNFNKKPVTLYYYNYDQINTENYFGTPYFEVIPEPSTGSLIGLFLIPLTIRWIRNRK